jgi:class 3 adenylate cyclase
VAAPVETRYVKTGGVHLAYQVLGDGPIDILLVNTWVQHVELWWDLPGVAFFYRRLAGLGRLVLFDRRGTGLSDPVPVDALPDLDAQVGDVVAVLDAAGVERAAVLGFAEGGQLALALAAARPERVERLVLFAALARTLEAPDYPWGTPSAVIEALHQQSEEQWSAGQDSLSAMLAPSRAGDAAFRAEVARLTRLAVRAGAMGALFRQTAATDVRPLLSSVRCPTLVLHRADDLMVAAAHGRYLAEHIPGARYVELPGGDHLFFTGDAGSLLEEIEEFLTGRRGVTEPDRVVATVLFTDIVGSTAQAAEVGDRQWRQLLDEHDRIVRRELSRFGGREVDHTGDGFFAVFAGPGQAIRCARSLAEAMVGTGLGVRTGMHTGECEVRGDNYGGLAVHIGARVAATAQAGEIVVSSTVRELLMGSPELEFVDRGEHTLKGIPGAWRLYAVER